MERFNLFNVGEGLFLNSLPGLGGMGTMGAIPTNTIHRARGPMAPQVPVDINIEVEDFGPGENLSPIESALLPLLRTLYQPQPNLGNTTTFFRQSFGGLPRTAGFQDVVVRPTQEQINAGSTLRTLDIDSTENCAVCQEPMSQGEDIRQLTGCNHNFHRACIDHWFERSVLCPTCRHDIRGPARNTPTLGPQASPPTTNQTNAVPQNPNATTNTTTPTRRAREAVDTESAILRMLFPNMNFTG